MRSPTVTTFKRETDTRQEMPRAGTYIRTLYDIFQYNKGKLVLATFGGKGTRAIGNLVDFYGMDIRSMGHRKWLFAGEWKGKEYVDYVLEETEKREARVRKIVKSRVHRHEGRHVREAEECVSELAENDTC
jgi:hypothetical protein